MNNKINRIHERALRIVYKDYESSFEDLLVLDKSMTFHQRNIHQVAIEMYKIKNDLSPKFMKNIFSTDTGEKSGRDFVRPNVNSVKKGFRSLRNFGPIVWNNMLPDKHKECTTLDQFKFSIKNWKPSNCPCNLCNPIVPGIGRTQTKRAPKHMSKDFYYY